MEKHASWIFLSHSSADIDKIRIIRNEFEKLGQNPLAFHLKCLSTDTIEQKNELEDLIKREINSRDWFVYCESENASKSRYVKMEREYVDSLHTKKVWHIDLSDNTETIKSKIKSICNDLIVRVIYAKEDEIIVESFSNELIKQDFSVILQEIDSQWEEESGIDVLFLTKTLFEKLSVKDDNIDYTKCLVLNFENKDQIVKENKKENFISIVDKIRQYDFDSTPNENDCYILAKLVKYASRRIVDMDAQALECYNRALEHLNHNKFFHPQKAVFFKTTDARDGYCDVYRFPCCGKYVVSLSEPSQYTLGGCSLIDENDDIKFIAYNKSDLVLKEYQITKKDWNIEELTANTLYESKALNDNEKNSYVNKHSGFSLELWFENQGYTSNDTYINISSLWIFDGQHSHSIVNFKPSTEYFPTKRKKGLISISWSFVCDELFDENNSLFEKAQRDNISVGLAINSTNLLVDESFRLSCGFVFDGNKHVAKDVNKYEISYSKHESR